MILKTVLINLFLKIKRRKKDSCASQAFFRLNIEFVTAEGFKPPTLRAEI